MNSNDASPLSILAPSASLWSKAPVGREPLPRTRAARRRPAARDARRARRGLQRDTCRARRGPAAHGARRARPSLLPARRRALPPEPNGPTRVELRVEDALILRRPAEGQSGPRRWPVGYRPDASPRGAECQRRRGRRADSHGLLHRQRQRRRGQPAAPAPTVARRRRPPRPPLL